MWGNFEIASAEQKQPQGRASVHRLTVMMVQRLHISTYSYSVPKIPSRMACQGLGCSRVDPVVLLRHVGHKFVEMSRHQRIGCKATRFYLDTLQPSAS